jgi:hypothetical protein
MSKSLLHTSCISADDSAPPPLLERFRFLLGPGSSLSSSSSAMARFLPRPAELPPSLLRAPPLPRFFLSLPVSSG